MEPTEEMKRMARLERFAGRNFGRIIFYGSAVAAITLAKIWEPRAGLILLCIAFLMPCARTRCIPQKDVGRPPSHPGER